MHVASLCFKQSSFVVVVPPYVEQSLSAIAFNVLQFGCETHATTCSPLHGVLRAAATTMRGFAAGCKSLCLAHVFVAQVAGYYAVCVHDAQRHGKVLCE
jgi:hypothetical protein